MRSSAAGVVVATQIASPVDTTPRGPPASNVTSGFRREIGRVTAGGDWTAPRKPISASRTPGLPPIVIGDHNSGSFCLGVAMRHPRLTLPAVASLIGCLSLVAA